jgi:biopolymer transport protein ExbD
MRKPIKRGRVMTEINITPFTDVVLVLLIIFMITTPLFVQSGIKIKLPNANSTENESGKNIVITIAPDGATQLNNRLVEENTLQEELTAQLTSHPNAAVIINADKSVQYDRVVRILDLSKKAGARRLALGVEYRQ